MSLKYAEKFGGAVGTTTPEMREHCKRPGKQDENGKPIYFTEQAHKKECDVNNIIKKYDKNGLITHVSKFEAKFGDVSGVDFQAMQEKVANAQSMFNQLPVEIRSEFENNPAKLLKFMDNPDNRDRAIELGLINKDWTEDTDGLGEHVLENEHKLKNQKPSGSEPEAGAKPATP